MRELLPPRFGGAGDLVLVSPAESRVRWADEKTHLAQKILFLLFANKVGDVVDSGRKASHSGLVEVRGKHHPCRWCCTVH